MRERINDLLRASLLAVAATVPMQAPADAQAAPPVGVPAQAQTKAVADIVERMQKVYEGTNDMRARFSQQTQGMMAKRQASGEVLLKKPGKMRWDYEKPEKKLFVADGTQLWVYEPEDEQAFKQSLSSSQLPAQVSFLFGKGRLSDEFDITLLDEKGKDAQGLGEPGDHRLKLVPRVATAQYRYLLFVVDPRTFLVKETVVHDQQGGQNRIRFSAIETNLKGGIDDARFRFTPPAGTKIINASR